MLFSYTYENESNHKMFAKESLVIVISDSLYKY